jgi:hypothetical protein
MIKTRNDSSRATGRKVTPLENNMSAVSRANANLRERAERRIAAFVEPESDRPTIINGLVRLIDGPEQRETHRLASEVFGQAREREA